VHRIGTEERRRRVVVRHHLGSKTKSDDVCQLAGELVGIHATDPASVYLGCLARMSHFAREDMANALYEERSLLKMLGMRRTMFVVPRDLGGVMHSAVTRALGVVERKRLIQMLTDARVDPDVPGWVAQVEKETVAALDDLGEATASQLTKRVPGLRFQISFGEGKKWGGKVGVSTRMLFLLATEARVIRGRPKGSWLSSMYAWAPMMGWLGGPLEHPPVDEAHAELVRRYLTTYGPATQRDIQWWTGWTVATTKKALAANKVSEVALDGGTGFALASDLDKTSDPGSSVALLPTLDTTTMGWSDRSWFLGDYASALFDRNGNAGPTIWVDGRVAGVWAQRPSGEVVYRLLEDVGTDNAKKVAAEAARIESWLGESRIIPRFRTPLEQELSR
jgi:DNA glycosylase AlkZ-like